MKAVQIHEHGDVGVLKFGDVPQPRPAPHEVLVEVKACALNHLDLWVRRGVPGYSFPLPLVPGSDIAGVVAEIGSVVKNVRVGDAVVLNPGVSCGTCNYCLQGKDNLCPNYVILGELVNGGNAQYVVAPAENALAMPEELTFEQAACLPLVLLTAWHMLVTRAQIKPGETILVQAGGSGVGSIGIQLAKLYGLTVITTASTKRKLEKCLELGADEAINYSKTNFYKEIKRITRGRGVDVVMEHTGAVTFQDSVKSLAWGGRLVMCGATSGYDAKLDLRQLFFRNLTLLGAKMGSKGELVEGLKFVRQGKIKPVHDCTFKLEEIQQAHKYLMDRKQFGKVVVVP